MAVQDYNSADVAFVQAMIPHHAAAVEMALRYINNGQNSTILAMAHDIASGQRDEISTFRSWLRMRGLNESGGSMSPM